MSVVPVDGSVIEAAFPGGMQCQTKSRKGAEKKVRTLSQIKSCCGVRVFFLFCFPRCFEIFKIETWER